MNETRRKKKSILFPPLLPDSSPAIIIISAGKQLLYKPTIDVMHQPKSKNMGSLSHEIKVKVPAAEAWSVYGTLGLAQLVREKLPHVLQAIDLLEGDGGVGTKLHLTYPPNPLIPYSKEVFTVVDEHTMTKVTEAYEGGYLNLGFTLYRITFHVAPDPADASSCTTQCTLEYQLKEDAPDNAAALISIQPLVDIMNAATDHLLKSPTAN